MSSGKQGADICDRKAPVKLAQGADLGSALLSAQEGFVLSRIDGESNIDTLCVSTGLGERTTLDVLVRLRSQGIVVVGDEPPLQSGLAATAGQIVGESMPRISARLHLDEADESHDATHADGVDLKTDVRHRISSTFRSLGQMNFFDLLGVDPEANRKEVRRAYFRRSKEFHPDRYYTKRLGAYENMLAEIFKQVSAAYKFLDNDGQRVAYASMITQERDDAALAEAIAQQAAQTETPITQDNIPLASDSREGGDAPLSSAPTAGHDRARSAAEKSGCGTEHGPEEVGAYTYTRTKGLRQREHVSNSMSAVVSRVDRTATSDRNRRPVDGERSDHSRTTRTSAVPEADDPARAARRKTDRHRRRRKLSTEHPVSVRRRRAKTFFEQGMAQLEAGKSLAAAASLKLAMTYDKQNENYRKQYQIAVDQSRDQTADGYFKRAIWEESVGRHEAAANLYVRAADVLPKGTYLLKAAEAMLWAEDLIKAKEYATKGVRLEPRSVDAKLVLGRVYLAGGMKKSARREVEAALKLDPGRDEAKKLLKQVKRSS